MCYWKRMNAKHIDETLRESNGTLRAMIQVSPLAIIAMDRDGKVTT